MTKEEALKKYFGHDSFREGQKESVEALLSGRDALCVMPTGAGKSVCYQIPALLQEEGVTIVVSPLISLMKDQVEALRQAGVRAAYLNSSLSRAECSRVLDGMFRGEFRLVYVAPERLESPEFLEVSNRVTVPLVIVDEAHCVSQWGQNFRPSYLKIANYILRFPHRPTVGAFTATATAKVKEDIVKLLKLQTPVCIMTGFDRPNLYFSVERPKKKEQRLLAFLREHDGESGIVYAATRKTVDGLYDLLLKEGVSAVRYHAGLPDEERKRNQEDFLFGRARVAVATNAFGMGIDKSDVSFVLHYQMPKDIESYYQEAGRAGRDGSPAQCVMFYSPQDVITQRFLIEKSEANPELSDEERTLLTERELHRLRQMTYYATTGDCLRRFLLSYFGEAAPAACGNCSGCLSEAKVVDITVDAQKIFSCVIRTGQRYGRKMLIDILRGSRNERLLSLGLDAQTTYGLLSGLSEREVRERFDYLEENGYLAVTGAEYPILTVTPACRSVLQNGATLSMRTLTPPKKVKEPSSPKKAVADPNLYDRLKALRLRLAREQGVPAFVVFSDATLRDMCAKQPRTPEEFLDVSGVGKAKAERYGELFIALVRQNAVQDE